MFCARCGTRASAGEHSCSLCGAALPGGGVTTGASAGEPAGPVTWSTPTQASAVATPAVLYAGFWRRFAGLLIDWCVLLFPDATLRVVLGLEPLSAFDPLTPASWIAATGELGLGWLYGALLIASPLRGTLGQQVMDLRVTDLNGRRLSFMRASWRYWAQFLTLLTFGVGYLVQPATPRRQTLHDWASSTVVVRPPRGREPAFASPQSVPS